MLKHSFPHPEPLAYFDEVLARFSKVEVAIVFCGPEGQRKHPRKNSILKAHRIPWVKQVVLCVLTRARGKAAQLRFPVV